MSIDIDRELDRLWGSYIGLNRRAEGEDVRGVLQKIDAFIPALLASPVKRSQTYEKALTLGAHLSVLIFSTDEIVAAEARKIAVQLGTYIHMQKGREAATPEDAILTLLDHADCGKTLIRFSIKEICGETRVDLLAEDAEWLLTGRFTPRAASNTTIRMDLECLQDCVIECLGQARIADQPTARIKAHFDAVKKAAADNLEITVQTGPNMVSGKCRLAPRTLISLV